MNRTAMYKFLFFVLVLAIMGLTSCRKTEVVQSQQNEYVRTDDSSRLACWLPEKDSVNNGYCLVAERLWMLGRDNDSVDLFDYNYKMQWHERCEETLVRCFDSKYPHLTLSCYDKSDSMVYVILRFLDEDSDGLAWVPGRICIA